MKIHTHALKAGDRAAINDFLNRIPPQDAQAASDFIRSSDVKVGVFNEGMNLIAIVFGTRSTPAGTFYISADGYDASRTVAMVTQVLEKQRRAASTVSSNAAGSWPPQQQQPQSKPSQDPPQLHKPSRNSNNPQCRNNSIIHIPRYMGSARRYRRLGRTGRYGDKAARQTERGTERAAGKRRKSSYRLSS